ncbi:hypothetical protein AOLI_G00307510 [Acnodon oligacanthus]
MAGGLLNRTHRREGWRAGRRSGGESVETEHVQNGLYVRAAQLFHCLPPNLRTPARVRPIADCCMTGTQAAVHAAASFRPPPTFAALKPRQAFCINIPPPT